MLQSRPVVIVHLGPLGDFLLTWPLAQALIRLCPRSRVVYITQAQKGALARQLLGVAVSDVEAGWPHFTGVAAVLPQRSMRLLAETSAIFSFHASREDPELHTIRRVCPSALFVPLRPPSRDDARAHYTETLVAQLRPWPTIQHAVRQELHSLAMRGVGPWRAPRGEVVIHPGSSSLAKCWPTQRFMVLAQRFRRSGLPVRVVLGAMELERWPSAEIQQFARVADVHQPTSLVELWQLLSSATLFLGNDSGPGHLAGIIGVPTFCLFGPTDPAVWKPLGPRVSVLRHEPLEALAEEKVYAWIKDEWQAEHPEQPTESFHIPKSGGVMDKQRCADEQPLEDTDEAPAYRRPHLVEVGKAVDLVQSYSWGAYQDSYSGYYWNR